ncbi:MAG: GNAT family N-acetyltransferase [Oscillospiraceae bacterium]|nr:GNAT family N-acetyltransferase [Oscillospiraceae bacterium]
MNDLSFVQIKKDDKTHFKAAKELWIPFSRELDEHEGITETLDDILHDLTRRINIQGSRPDMHFEIAYAGKKAIGIAMFAIDTGTVYGLLESGYGVITGFYIRPEYRRRGYGKAFFHHIETTLRKDGAPKLYLTPDAVTGEPFWTTLGFVNSGKYDPDDRKFIYIKSCTDSFDNCDTEVSR